MSLTLLLACLLGACSAKQPMQVGWDYDPATDFAGLKSYAWVPGEQARTGDPRVDQRYIDERVRRAIDTQLAAQGFVAAPAAAQADFWIGYHLRVVDKVTTRNGQQYGYGYPRTWSGNTNIGLGWRLGGAPAIYTHRYDVGTLTVFIESPATQQPLWRGFARAEIEPSDDLDTREQRVAKAAAAILQRFPPGAGTDAPSP